MDESDYKEAAQEAKEGFDLDEVLTGRADLKRTKTVRVYMDEETGEALGGITFVENMLGQKKKERWGILGDIDFKRDELKLLNAVIENVDGTEQTEEQSENHKTYLDRIKELEAEIEDLKEQAKPLQEKLDESAIDIEVRYLPPIIVKDARKDARKELGLKKVTEENAEDYLEELNAQILVRAAVAVTQVGTGKVNKSIGIETARRMYGMLPSSEQDKLNDHIDKIVFKSKIAQHLALDADF